MSPADPAAAAPAGASWRIPGELLLPALVVGVGLLVPIGLAYLLAGAGPALVVGVSYAAAVPLATSGLAASPASARCVAVALVAVVAVAVGRAPLPAASLVALLVLVTVPGSPFARPGLAGLPAMAAVLAALPSGLDPVAAGAWALFGSVVVVVGLTAVRRRGTAPEAPAGAAEDSMSHAVVSAAAVGAILWAVLRLDVPHGYWAVLTLILVLRRSQHETNRTARWRVAGTVLGVVIAVLLAVVLPPWAVAVAVGVLLVGLVGYALAGNYPLQVACLTSLIILLGAAEGGVAHLVAERVVTTVVGAVAAAAVGALVLLLERRASAASGSGPPGPGETSGVAE